MPQFDTATFLTQIVWLVIAFAGLYIVMWKVALPKLAGILEARQSRIDDDLERAASLKSEADAVLTAYEKAMASAREDAQGKVRAAAEAAAAEATERHQALGAKLAAEIKAAEARIADAKQAALGNVEGVAADAARDTTAKLMGVTVDEAAAKQAVGDIRRGA